MSSCVFQRFPVYLYLVTQYREVAHCLTSDRRQQMADGGRQTAVGGRQTAVGGQWSSV
ncbi:MAG: hypothetical protein KKD28_14000 [Chloroflexi bacterium]|nr:hypothetical protein [Chloroflexota bacterium]MBU1662575.1 hypothetical protein [Chloroflexota bacterium]